jgi:cyclopropane fatty-acyl-phospholipid synthase-like methyltransferase
VLDVGCGDGAFLRFLRQRNPTADLTGIDVGEDRSEDAYRFIRSDYAAFRPERRFDVVTALGVIEHIGDVHAFVRYLADAVADGGALVIMTVDADGFVYRLADGLARRGGIQFVAERLFDPHHLNHFAGRSLRRLVQGVDVEETAWFRHNFPLAAIDLPPSLGRHGATVVRAVLTLVFKAPAVFPPMLQTVICRRRTRTDVRRPGEIAATARTA